jgi:hypothetical protein
MIIILLGLELLILALWCPNQGVRTRFALFSLLLSESEAHSDTDCSFSLLVSESGAHSDKVCSFYHFDVRIKGTFGQGLLFLVFSCPNQGLIRTRFALFSLFVSESRAHSDKVCSF